MGRLVDEVLGDGVVKIPVVIEFVAIIHGPLEYFIVEAVNMGELRA